MIVKTLYVIRAPINEKMKGATHYNCTTGQFVSLKDATRFIHEDEMRAVKAVLLNRSDSMVLSGIIHVDENGNEF